jgi:hypothetical protein
MVARIDVSLDVRIDVRLDVRIDVEMDVRMITVNHKMNLELFRFSSFLFAEYVIWDF